MGVNKDSFTEKMRETIKRLRLIQKGDGVLIALSGGPDSVALLYGLVELKSEYDLKLHVAHLNHKLRGAESDEDERFCKKLASSLKLRYHSRRVDVKKKAQRRKAGIEETAREVRYRYLEQLADKIGVDKIALGHQADDQAETFLMRLIRGAGAAGLAGIPVKRGRIVRPLMQIKREEIEDFLKAKGICYRLDSSNYLTDYYRNKIRLLLLPQIKEKFNPKIVESLNRAADIISLQQAYVHRAGEQILKQIGRKKKGEMVVSSDEFSALDPCLQREMTRLCVQQMGGDVNRLSFELVDRALNLIHQKKSGRRLKLTGKIWFEAAGDRLVFYVEEKKAEDRTVELPGRLNLKDWGLKIESKIVNGKSRTDTWSGQNRNLAFLDWAKLKPPFVLRSRRRGDRFKPLGMKGTKSLADFLIDAKVPQHRRNRVPVLTSRGKIVWLVGQRISDEFKVTGNTKKMLKLEATGLQP